VNPTNEKLFQAACGTFEVDIISLDMSARLPFYLKHSTVGLAVERGIYFELCYGAAIRGTDIIICSKIISTLRGREVSKVIYVRKKKAHLTGFLTSLLRNLFTC
jgi:ribonuclease P/MRP protein subunit RPP1